MILLDTHIWIRWLLPTEPLPKKLTDLIEIAEADRFIIATAIVNNTELISLDNCFPLYVELNDLLITA
ncbi:MAG: hypothetical protein D3913_04685 [Candidatus Electrothrix sp. LOE1_4_5]|nr:hypothetical protein [Candidatus Electrothrix gigas]MCI5189672.1 hypothetical protein [Candidatus Electrothrix gigas]